MFEKLRQLKQLKNLQDDLGKEKAEAEREGIKVVVNGKMEVEEIRLNAELGKERQEVVVKDCVNEALDKIKLSAARKMLTMKEKLF
jgi:DNA-binding protein YbaB